MPKTRGMLGLYSRIAASVLVTALVLTGLLCVEGSSAKPWPLTPARTSERREAKASRPDVLVITLDTTRADHLGCYGYSGAVSPELDRFALDAVRYRRAWSTASWTLPAHGSILTGKHPSSHGAHFAAGSSDLSLASVVPSEQFADVRVNRLAEQETTLAELLGDAGYQTAAIVGGPWMTPTFGLMQGYSLVDADVHSVAGRSADQLTDRAIAWIRSVPRERPVHLLLNYFDPHSPYEPPPGYHDLPGAHSPLKLSLHEVIALYDGEIRFMDHHFGRLVDALRAAGRYDGALIVVVADHGENFGEHGLMNHGPWLSEEVLRVPLLIHWPGGRDAGTADDASVSHVDLLPLIAGEVGVPVPDGVEGMPLGRRDLVLAESFRDAHFIREHGARFDRELVAGIRWPWKLILSDRGAADLYRLDQDRGELHNRAGEAAEGDLRGAIEAARARLRPPSAAALAQVDSRTHARLRALGYAE